MLPGAGAQSDPESTTDGDSVVAAGVVHDS